MSRKTLLFIVGAFGIVATAIQTYFGLSVELASVASSLGVVLTYVFFEAKLDAKAMASQPGKWKDGKFWIALGTSLLAYIDQTFQLGLPSEQISQIAIIVVGMLFGVKFTKPTPY